MKLHYEPDRKVLEEKAVELITKSLNSAISKNGSATFGIPGGRSVQGVFKLLLSADIQWEHVHVFMIDERCVPVTSDESNFKGAYETFLRSLIAQGKLPEPQVHAFHYRGIHHESCLLEYNQAFVDAGGKFDVALLGVGEDGHIASLFPGHNVLSNGKSEFITIKGSPKPPSRRISASPKLLKEADTSIILFFGKSKLDALSAFQDLGTTKRNCPAKIVIANDNLHILTDQK